MTPHLRFNEKRITVIVSGVAPNGFTEILAPASGYQYAITNLLAANLETDTRAINFYEQRTSKLCPQIALGASGTLIWDKPGQGPVDLGIGSGLYGQMKTSGSVEVTAYYYQFDERTPITKAAARAASYTGKTITRVPNVAGNQ
jgi:hypothetical protein